VKLLGIFIVACALMLVVVASLMLGGKGTARHVVQVQSPAPVPTRPGPVEPTRDTASLQTSPPKEPTTAALPQSGVTAEHEQQGAEAETSVDAAAAADIDDPEPRAEATWPDDPRVAEIRRRLVQARAALRADPNHETARRDEVAALCELGDWRGAATALQPLLDLHPDDTQLHFELATILLRLHRWLEAIGALKTVVSHEPDNHRAWFNLAVAHQKLGHLDEARRAWDRTVTLDPSPAAHERRGEVLLDLREWAAAAEDFQAVLTHHPDADDATLNLALAWSKLGRHRDARTLLERFLADHPRHIPALNRLANVCWEAFQTAPDGNPNLADEVVTWCQRSLDVDPHQEAIQTLLTQARHAAQDGD